MLAGGLYIMTESKEEINTRDPENFNFFSEKVSTETTRLHKQYQTPPAWELKLQMIKF